MINAAIGTLAWASGAVVSLVRTGVGVYELTVDQIDLLEYVIKTQTVVASINACVINIELVSPVLLRVRTSSANVAFDIDFLLMIERAQTKRDANVFVPSPVPPPPAAGAGNVVGPAGATDNAIVRFDGATGLLIQDSTVLVSDLGAVQAPAGTALLPAYSYAADLNSGFFSSGADQISLSLGGAETVRWTVNQILSANLGNAGAPAWSFVADPNTGAFSSGADLLDWSTGGVSRLTLSTTALTSTVVALGPAGAIGAPTWSFSGDTNSGFYSSGADQVSLSLGGAEAVRWAVGQILSASLGNAGAPAWSFVADPNTGVFSSGADLLDWSTGGVSRLTLSTATLSSTVVMLGPAGAIGAPTWSFSGDTNSGFYSSGADQVSLSLGGAEAFRWTATQNLSVGLGAAGTPAWSFTGDADTGMYSSGANILNWATAGVLRLSLSNTSLTVVGSILGQNGAVGTPSYSFSGAATSGMFRPAANTVALAGNGVERIRLGATGLSFFAAAEVAQQNIVGSRAAGAALTDLLTKLALTGLIVDSTTA